MKIARLAAIIFFGFSMAGPVFADLDEADMSNSNAGVKLKKHFDAWCQRSKNDCQVKFENGRLIVNDGGGIEASQLLNATYEVVCRDFFYFGRPNCNGEQWMNKEFKLFYKSIGGELKTAKIIFRNSGIARKFKDSLESWSSRPIGSGPLNDVNVKQISDYMQ